MDRATEYKAKARAIAERTIDEATVLMGSRPDSHKDCAEHLLNIIQSVESAVRVIEEHECCCPEHCDDVAAQDAADVKAELDEAEANPSKRKK